MRISAPVFFYARQRIKYAYDRRIFPVFIRIFFWCDVTRLICVMVMFLVFETFNEGSVLTKSNTLNFYTNVINFFLQ